VRTKIEVRSFTRSWDNLGYCKKFGQSLDMPTLPFLQNFNGLLFGWPLRIYQPNLKSVTSPVSEIIAIGVLGGVANPNFGEEETVWGRGWYRSKERW